MKTKSHSFANRLTTWVILTVFVTMTILTYLIYSITKAALSSEAEQRYQGMIAYMNESVDRELSAVEAAISNNEPKIVENLHNPDAMFNIVEHVLQLNPNIVGSAIAFEPNYYKDKGEFFSPYAYRVDSVTIGTKQLGDDNYQYQEMDWYKTPKEEGKPYWCDPYFDKGGGEMRMTTYSLPLFDSNGELYAIFTADISLDWLSNKLEKIDERNNDGFGTIKDNKYACYSFIIGRNAAYIAHPNHSRILKDSFFTYADKTKSQDDNEIGFEMIAGKQGIREFDNEGTQSVIFYSPINRTNWSMAIVVSTFFMYLPANLLSAIILVLMLIGMVALFFVCRIAVRHVSNPLTKFAQAVDEVANGNLNADLPAIKTNDEMLQLRNSFKYMQQALINQMEELKEVNKQKGRIESELQIARDIQMAMLPKVFPPFPERTDIDLYGMLIPAKEVSGDLYDFFIRDQKLFFCIGDVSGKGVPAALVMAVTKALFRSISAQEESPSSIMHSINETLTKGNETNMFVTAFAGTLDLTTGKLLYCNAGHNAPLIINAKKRTIIEVDSNIPLGIMANWDFSLQTTSIEPGSLVFLYTDGLTEAENIDYEQFGEERIFEVIQTLMNEGNVQDKELIVRLNNAVHAFAGKAEQSDDLTMLAIQYNQKAQ
ncbi:MAG: SpoIIE family protein phosphatase [Bacteroidaceae bacterium]|nr:SpoIIE family protein phosphatase [Bacteroidaceae bacterium]